MTLMICRSGEDITDQQSGEFRYTKPTGIERLDDRYIPRTLRMTEVDAVDHATDLFITKHLR